MKSFFKVTVVIVAVVVVAGYAFYRYKNQPSEDYYSYYLKQDMTPVGKAGVFLVGLHTPEDNDPTWWYNILEHSVHANIPWPAQTMALADNGVALVDPDRFYAHEEFVPERLIDRFGSEHDMDRTPYIEKYREGLVVWQAPREATHLDTGYWLYTGRNDGIPSRVGKRINLAEHWFYGKGIKQQKIPADYQSRKIYELAFGALEESYPGTPYYYADTLDPYMWRKKIFSLLDSGVETLLLASPMVMYSDYEDFHNGFAHSFDIVREWESQNDRKIKIIIVEPMGYQKAMRDGYLLILKDKLDTLPAGIDVKMVWSIHGMPWSRVPNESWLKMSPPYKDAMKADAEQLLSQYEFGRTEVVISQDHFADHYWNPDGAILSTNQAYLDGVEDGYDYVLSIPIEFYNENTDTLYTHAMSNYENFPGFDVYDSIDYPDWDTPYTSHFEIDGTRIDYLGIPTGDRYRPYVAQALYDSFDAVLSGSAGVMP
jgi:protoheme ferro-lyase